MRERVDRQPAFVLHERAYRETSAILELLTRDHGRVAVVARGLRAPRPRFSRGSLRALQPVECDWIGQGEMGLLVAVEATALPIAAAGVQLQSALYVNELLVRLLARHDPHPKLFDAYAGLLANLPGDHAALGFALRRFEVQLLAELGYGIDFAWDLSSRSVVLPEQHYRVDPEQGVFAATGPGRGAVSGRALLALGGDQLPAADALADLRRMMRSLLLHHLGGRELNAWRVLRSPVRPADPV
ncbi:MAG: DNA repair protein RecO [Xanthomonadales bacterium]|jgi:DNA repair protein RecO (recombination protein O)|nr:DNA repair protein RecO [Xanthomonadales bacterium]MBK7147041.1 DNA repair protein RecO [Xanthomonadales bacterium]